jgi:hypothetical protein
MTSLSHYSVCVLVVVSSSVDAFSTFTLEAELCELLALLLVFLLVLLQLFLLHSVDRLNVGLFQSFGNVVFLVEILVRLVRYVAIKHCRFCTHNLSNHFDILSANDEDAARDIAEELLDVDALDRVLQHEVAYVL